MPLPLPRRRMRLRRDSNPPDLGSCRPGVSTRPAALFPASGMATPPLTNCGKGSRPPTFANSCSAEGRPHGHRDQFVPVLHGQWSSTHMPGVDAELSQDEGHFTLWVGKFGVLHRWLLGNAEARPRAYRRGWLEAKWVRAS